MKIKLILLIIMIYFIEYVLGSKAILDFLWKLVDPNKICCHFKQQSNINDVMRKLI